MPAGRPYNYKTKEELQKAIDAYFDSCFEEQWIKNKDGWEQVLDHNGNAVVEQVRPFTITGLGLHLGLCRQALLNYEGRQEFMDTIKRAKQKIENYAEEQLFQNCNKNAQGVMFNLKNNYGWKDKTEQELTVNDLKIVVKKNADGDN